MVIDVRGAADRADRRVRNIARVGVDLSEASIGTSAIGAALGELQPVWLHRGEHFYRDTSAYSCAGAPLFAGWRAQPVPTDRAAAAAHQLNVLRELRGAYHAGAVLAAGLTPREAIALEHPAMAPIHGWSDDVVPDQNLQVHLDRAAAGAEAAMARRFEVLDDDESEAFAAACATLHAQIAAP